MKNGFTILIVMLKPISGSVKSVSYGSSGHIGTGIAKVNEIFPFISMGLSIHSNGYLRKASDKIIHAAWSPKSRRQCILPFFGK